MLRHVQIEEETKRVLAYNLVDGMDETTAVKSGLSAELYEIEQAYDGQWYLKGNAPKKPLDLAKTEKIAELKEARDKEEQDFFVYNEHRYNSDAVSCQRITDTVLLANAVGDSFSIVWTDYDNEHHTLNKDDMVGLLTALAMHSQACHYKYNELKEQVNTCKSVKKVEAIKWESTIDNSGETDDNENNNETPVSAGVSEVTEG